jgi:hypothetical protein
MGSASQPAAPREKQGQEPKMTTTNTTEIALFCTSGLVQYASSIESMLAEYNGNSRTYEVRTTEDGSQILWHKGHSRAVGTFKPANRG